MEEFTGMDMDDMDPRDALDAFDPSSDRTGARVHPGGWGSMEDAGPMKGDFFGLEVEARPLVERGLTEGDLETLLSTAFGEHATEIARRMSESSGEAAEPSSVESLLPPRARSRREQLATLLSVAFGANVDEVMAAMPPEQDTPAAPEVASADSRKNPDGERQAARREAMAKLVAMALGEQEAPAAPKADTPAASPAVKPAAAPAAAKVSVQRPLAAASKGPVSKAAPQVAAPKSMPPKTRPAAAVSTASRERDAAMRKLVEAARNPADTVDQRKKALKSMIEAARTPAEVTERSRVPQVRQDAPAPQAPKAPQPAPVSQPAQATIPQVAKTPQAVKTAQPAPAAKPAQAKQAAPQPVTRTISKPAPVPQSATQVVSKPAPAPAPQTDLAAQLAATVAAVRAETAPQAPAPEPKASPAQAPASSPAADPAPEMRQAASTPARKPGGSGRPHVPSGRGGAGGAGSAGGGAAQPKQGASASAAVRDTPVTAPRPRPANDPATEDASSGIGWGLFMIAVFGSALYGWTQKDTGVLTAETGIGYYLGIAGAAMMFLLLLYPMRKKLNFMRRMGPVKYWFQTHMVMGVLGPLLVVFHSNFELGSLNSRIALGTMLVVAFSGLFGRFMYTKIHHGLYGRRASAAEMRMGLKNAHGTLEGDIEFPDEMNERLVRLEKWLNAPSGVIGRTWRLLTVRPRTLWTRFRIRRLARVALRQRAEQDGWDRKRLVRHRQALRKHFKEYYRSVHSVAEFGFYERIFGLWHLLHFPLFLMMVFAAAIHVIAVHMY